MVRRYFGTDGIRGTANQHPMTAEMALKLGMAAGKVFRRGDHRHLVVIGKDTRLSGYMFESALISGFVAMGMDVRLLGPVPTPAVGMLTRSLRADIGVMISASHNPFYDNGIKLFGPDGYKLSDDVERLIEENMDAPQIMGLARPEKIGRSKRLEDAPARYIEIAKATFPRNLSLEGLKIVVDCANGAAYRVAPAVLYELGAEVITMGVEPNGSNINKDCGSLHPEGLRHKVLDAGADLGIALDGDADRVTLCDENGNIIDGDQIMGVIALYWKKKGLLHNNTLVSTVMSNMGLEKALKDDGITLERTAVGDRYVVECMRKGGFNLGGEQSGHIVMTDHATTGDGLLAALQIIAVALEQNKPLSQVCRVFKPFPQVLKNLRFTGEPPLEKEEVKTAIAESEARLGDKGRVLIRKSGTEPLIRVMVEAETEEQVAQESTSLVGAITPFLGG